jgi:hypothetical protein
MTAETSHRCAVPPRHYLSLRKGRPLSPQPEGLPKALLLLPREGPAATTVPEGGGRLGGYA